MLSLRGVLLALLLAAWPSAGAAQVVRVQGDTAYAAARLVREIVARGDFLLLQRDTVLPPTFRAPGDLVVLRADVRLEGSVAGSVAVVGGAFFLRPGGTVGGPVASLAGEVYLSRQGTAGPALGVPPEVDVRISGDPSGVDVVLTGPPERGVLDLPGAFGVSEGSYDRVDGATIGWGAGLDLWPVREGARLDAVVRYRSARGEVDGTVTAEYPVGRRLWLSASVGRDTRTEEEWIRGDPLNSLAALFVGSDPRNYYRSDAASLTFERRLEEELEPGQGFVAPRLTLLASRDRSLRATNAWHLFGDEWRENPAIDDGTLVSLTAGSGLFWTGSTTVLEADVAVEWAPPSLGDFEFSRLVLDGHWDMTGLWQHTVGMDARFLVPLSGTVPGQRWSHVGGSGTLSTLPTASLRGDHLALVETTYTIPVPSLTFPLVGSPSVQLRHAVGSAWASGAPAPDWEQNLGLGVAFSFFRVVAWINPAAANKRPEFSIGGSLPLP